ncbi:acyl-CoA synthetase [Methanococcoides methylutens]|uniref:Acetyl-coenzyme A synthetase n=1 Tax=Methanococcoides methylutens MM1 TaxID=1434104 RepID=A0A0E3SSD2_METMT|nr:AMP-binding protein [Methanococcoides methylutens]AKB85287.1 Acetyl-coenzyme A synthetase [Methanococcoides methylutens MM1]
MGQDESWNYTPDKHISKGADQVGKEKEAFDYEEERKSFNWDIPEDYNFVDTIRKLAADSSNLMAVTGYPDGTVEKASYQEVWDSAMKFGNVLRDSGIHKGDRVLVILRRGSDVYVTSIAIWAIGGVVVPGTIMLKSRDIEYRMQDAGIKALITNDRAVADEVDRIKDSIADRIPAIDLFFSGQREGWKNYEQEIDAASGKLKIEKLTANDLLAINYTSGTTGAPKGVLHTHSLMYCFDRLNRHYWWNTQSDERCWATTEPGWAKWYWGPFGAVLNAGATNFHYAGRFDPEKWFELLDRWKINRACFTPTELRSMATIEDADQRFELSELKVILTAGEPCTPGIVKFFGEKFGVPVREGYGQTESCVIACTLPGMEIRPGSMGKFTPGVEGAIVDPDTGEKLPPGEKGTIAVVKDHPMLFKGYHNKPEKTAECFIGDWYLTGDLAMMDDDGYIWFESRSDDICLSSGYRIGPFEVESAVDSHEAVLESAMIPSPDQIRGEIVKVFVVLREGYKPSEQLVKDIQKHVKEVTAPYKYPREIEFVRELPKTISGKIKRKELRMNEFETKKDVIEKLKEKGLWKRSD